MLALHELEQQIDLAKKRAENAPSKINEAEHILQSNACEEREAANTSQSEKGSR